MGTGAKGLYLYQGVEKITISLITHCIILGGMANLGGKGTRESEHVAKDKITWIAMNGWAPL